MVIYCIQVHWRCCHEHHANVRMHNVSQRAPAFFVFRLIPVLTSCYGLSRLKRCEDGASVIHIVKKGMPRRTEQVRWAAFNPQCLSCDSDSRLIKMSETIQLINGRDKTPPMFSSPGDSEAVHTFFRAVTSREKRLSARPSCTNECVYVCIGVCFVCVLHSASFRFMNESDGLRCSFIIIRPQRQHRNPEIKVKLSLQHNVRVLNHSSFITKVTFYLFQRNSFNQSYRIKSD